MVREELAAHIARNSEPILDVLRTEFANARDVLEIGSGNGQHATWFAAGLAHLRWQTSDLGENCAAIRGRLEKAGLPNVLAPLSVDVRDTQLPAAAFDAVFSANTAHIMSEGAVEKMFHLVAQVLRPGGLLCLYGPFRQNGAFNADSNRRFHESLRARDPAMGIRDLATLHIYAARGSLVASKLYGMPANNFIAIWQKRKRN
jgi:cyclopropane fatty-acyl-phospholipid synthase-like methyltransferase